MKFWLLFSISISSLPWRDYRDEGGLHLEARDVPGSAFEEVRVRAKSAASAERLCAVIWGDEPRQPSFKENRLLRVQGDERWTYQRVSAPLVSDRDYILYRRRALNRDTGGCQVFFETQNTAGPPPAPGVVRMEIRGLWTFTPTADGGAEVAYVVYSDPGGGIPAAFSRGKIRDNAFDWTKQVLARAEAMKQGS